MTREAAGRRLGRPGGSRSCFQTGKRLKATSVGCQWMRLTVQGDRVKKNSYLKSQLDTKDYHGFTNKALDYLDTIYHAPQNNHLISPQGCCTKHTISLLTLCINQQLYLLHSVLSTYIRTMYASLHFGQTFYRGNTPTSQTETFFWAVTRQSK